MTDVQKFRARAKESFVVEAMQWDGTDDTTIKIQRWTGGAVRLPQIPSDCVRVLKVDTPDGERTAQVGDWIIKDTQGAHYAYTSDGFEGVFTPVEEPTTDLPIRAYWWREVTDPDEVIPAGCPVRTEEASEVRRILIAHEYVAKKSEPRPKLGQTYRGRRRIFIDSRWTPPVRKLKVGDLIVWLPETEKEELTDD